MKRPYVEVFVERNCRSCIQVLQVVGSLAERLDLELQVYEREADNDVFAARSVMIIPATFVNSRLAFYGSFTSEELIRFITSHQNYHSQQGVAQ